MQVPARATGAWRVRLRDLDTGTVLLEDKNQGALVTSPKRYFIRTGIEVWELDEAGTATEVFSHHYDAGGKEVLIRLPVGTLGDTLGWFPYVARFAERHGARVTCAMSRPIIPLLQDAYPHMRFISYDGPEEQQAPRSAYATYSVALFFGDDATTHQPEDFRRVGLHRTAGYILGVRPEEEKPRLVLPDESRPIPEPYVCIAVQSSMQCKSWNNPHGWRDVIRFLKALGFRGGLHRPEAGAWQRSRMEPHSAWCGGSDRRSSADGTRAVAAARGILRRAEQRVVLAGLGGRYGGGADQRLHRSIERVRNALPGDQSGRLQ